MKNMTKRKKEREKERKKIWFRQSATFARATNKYKWNSSTNKTEQVKVKQESKSLKLLEVAKKIQGFPIGKDPFLNK